MLRVNPALLFVVALLALASLANAERCKEGWTRCVKDNGSNDYKVCVGGKSRQYKCPGALVCRDSNSWKGGRSNNVHCAGRSPGSKASSSVVEPSPTAKSGKKQRIHWAPTTNRRYRPTTTKKEYAPTTKKEYAPTTKKEYKVTTKEEYKPTTTQKTKSPETTRKTGGGGGGGSGTYSGEGTYYDVGIGSCGDVNSNSELVAALNGAQMGNGANPNNNPNCGRKVQVHGPLGSVVVTIVDTCPPCAYGDVDLSPTAFEKIGKKIDGRIPITWSWVN